MLDDECDAAHITISTRIAIPPASHHTAVVQDLCIIPGQHAWCVNVDAIVLECGAGNIYDCIALAVKAALLTTKIPVV